MAAPSQRACHASAEADELDEPDELASGQRISCALASWPERARAMQ